MARITDAFASEYLDSCHISAYVKFRPCSGVGSQSAYVVVHRICTSGPADSAIFFEYFGCGGGFFAVGELRLRKRVCFAVGDVLHSFEGQLRAKSHQPVVDGAGVFIRGYFDFFSRYDVAGVYLVFKEECGNPGFRVAIHNGTVYRRSSAISGQERGMQVEGSKRGHGPNRFRQHPECNHDKEVGLESL